MKENNIYLVSGKRADLIQAISFWLGTENKTIHPNLDYLIHGSDYNDLYTLAILYVDETGKKESFLSFNTEEGIYSFFSSHSLYNEYKRIKFDGYINFRKFLENKMTQKYEIGDIFSYGESPDKRYFMLCTNYAGQFFFINLNTYTTVTAFDNIDDVFRNTFYGDLVYVGKIGDFLKT